MSLLLEILFQPLAVAVLVFIAYLNRDKVDPYRLNFLYFSTLYAFWIGLFGACQAINSEVRSGEWCYWVLGMGRNRTTHILAVLTSCLLFALAQCFVFFLGIVISSWVADAPFNHFVDMFVSIPSGEAFVDPIYQMNGAFWFTLSAKWGSLGPMGFAAGLFALSLLAALVSGTMFGILFSAVFRDPATSLNIAVGFVVFLGMISLCGLRGDGAEKVDALFAPLRDIRTVYKEMNRENFASNAVPAAAISYVLPQRYFFNVGRITFKKEWSHESSVQEALRKKLMGDACPYPKLRFNSYWTRSEAGVTFKCSGNICPWINGWGIDYPLQSEYAKFSNWSEPEPHEMVDFLRLHPEHRRGWQVALHRNILLMAIGLEMLPLLLLDLLCLAGTLLAVWKKQCYQQLR